MPKQIAKTTAVLVIDYVVGSNQVLNAYTVNTTENPTLTKDGALAQRTVTSDELNNTLNNFIQVLLNEAKNQEGV